MRTNTLLSSTAYTTYVLQLACIWLLFCSQTPTVSRFFYMWFEPVFFSALRNTPYAEGVWEKFHSSLLESSPYLFPQDHEDTKCPCPWNYLVCHVVLSFLLRISSPSLCAEYCLLNEQHIVYIYIYISFTHDFSDDSGNNRSSVTWRGDPSNETVSAMLGRKWKI